MNEENVEKAGKAALSSCLKSYVLNASTIKDLNARNEELSPFGLAPYNDKELAVLDLNKYGSIVDGSTILPGLKN